MSARRSELGGRLVTALKAEPRVFVTRDLATAGDGDRLGADLGLDSVGMLYLVMAIEDAFDVEVDDAEDLAERFATWGQVLDYLESVAA